MFVFVELLRGFITMVKKKLVESSADSKNNYLSTKNVLIFWLVVIVLGWLIFGSGLGLGLLVASIICLLIIHFSINSEWEGTIQSIKSKKVYSGDPNADVSDFREVNYAYIKLSSGKTKKVQAYPDWKVGDKIKKEKGKFGYQKF